MGWHRRFLLPIVTIPSSGYRLGVRNSNSQSTHPETFDRDQLPHFDHDTPLTIDWGAMQSLSSLIFVGSCLVTSVRLSAQEPANSFAPVAVPDDGFSLAPMPVRPEQLGVDPLSDGTTQTEQSLFPRYPPGMFGDLLEIESLRRVVGNHIEAIGPVAFRSALRISDNESPRPLDRVFINGNDFSTVNRLFVGPSVPSENVYREMVGFEKTFLHGNASVGLRLPFFQLTGDPGLGETRTGDLSVIFKYAFLNNRATGHALSGGLVVTAPTGPGLRLAGQSMLNPVYLQPWFGDVWTYKNLFVQGFTSVAVPTDTRDAVIFFKSIGVGYWLYRADGPNRILSAVVPSAEFHLTDPWSRKGLSNLSIDFPVMLDFMGGFYVFLRRAVLGVGVGTPLTGPKPYEYMVNTSLNFRF